jgi:hypothetical protein
MVEFEGSTSPSFLEHAVSESSEHSGDENRLDGTAGDLGDGGRSQVPPFVEASM